VNNNGPEPLPLKLAEEQLPPVIRDYFWSPHHRRPAFLIILVTGLLIFIIRLPGTTRASLWSAFVAQRELVVLLILFVLLTLSLIWSAGQRMDSRVFLLFNTRKYPKWLDRCMWLTTQLGNLLAAFIVAILVFFLYEHRLALQIIFGTLTLLLLVETIKVLADRDRPFLTLDKARVIGWKERGDSFPSGHTSQIFFMMTLFIQYFHLGLAGSATLYAIAALVGFTRIYVGAHYPRDVIAGMVLGTVWGILVTLVTPYWVVRGF
jgi:membrane-associated phospholipid phosphatase